MLSRVVQGHCAALEQACYEICSICEDTHEILVANGGKTWNTPALL